MAETPLAILLIEEDDRDFLVLRDALAAMAAPGCKVERVRSCSAAGEVVRKRRHDLYLVDQRPGADGERITRSLLRLSGEPVPVIVLSGEDDPDDARAALQAGAADYLIKEQVTPPLLERAIRHAVERARAEEARAQVREQAARAAAEAAERRIASLYAEANEAIRSRDEFLSFAAHELRTPVTALRGFAQLALRQLDRRGDLDPERRRQVLEEIEGQTSRLTQLVNQLLDISRLAVGRLTLEREMVDVVAIVKATVRSLRRRGLPQTIRVRAPEGIAAYLDPARIEHVLLSLLDHAVAHSPESKPIEVDAGTPMPNTVRIAVRDHGAGISAELHAGLFERFQPAQADGEFRVPGLYISRQIAELHGGTLTLDSPPGGGTRFTLLLPRRAEQADEPATAPLGAVRSGGDSTSPAEEARRVG